MRWGAQVWLCAACLAHALMGCLVQHEVAAVIQVTSYECTYVRPKRVAWAPSVVNIYPA
jgi:hypothetical protein